MAPKRKTGGKSEGSETKKGKVEKHKTSESEVVPASPSYTGTLDSATQDLVEFIFDEDMFKQVLQNLDIDIKKMPADEISIPQIDKGFSVLEKLEEAMKQKEEGKVEVHEFSSKFYDTIPHKTCPVILTQELVQEKYNMLNVLADIELALRVQKDNQDDEKVKHPLDVKYGLLNCELKLLSRDSKEYELIIRYIMAKRGNLWRTARLLDVWSVDRKHQELEYIKRDLFNRKLLWYGDNVACTAAILKTGLHIKPHSGGRIGHGIYFADDILRSAYYAAQAQDKAILFLCEVALGGVREILHNSSAPNTTDSCKAVGTQGPDVKQDVTMQFDGKDVIIPVGKSKPLAKNSWFLASQYAISNEDQYRIRYIALFDNL